MKCHMNKTLVLSGAGILLIALVASCAFPFQSAEVVGLSDISGRLAFYDISRQGFMGEASSITQTNLPAASLSKGRM